MQTYEANIKQKKNGPHKSQFLISFLFSAVSATGLIGLITILSFCQIRYKSLFYILVRNNVTLTIVSDTGSSNVLRVVLLFDNWVEAVEAAN